MSAYHKAVDEILKQVDMDQIESEVYQKRIAELMITAFEKIYGKKFVTGTDCEEDNGFADVPARIKTQNGKVYLGLLYVCVEDSGENYGIQIFFKKYGVIPQEHFKKRLTKRESEGIIPYKYRPLIEIAGDIHRSDYF